MAAPRVTIVRDAHVPGGASGEGRVVPLAVALVQSYATDAHFSAAVADGRRCTRECVGATPIALEVVAFDVDCREVHGTGKIAPEAWCTETSGKIAALAAKYPAPFAYFTRGGCRIIYALPAPFAISSPADGAAWRAHYLAACDLLARDFGIECDRSCADWQRLFRLPHATRTPGASPENWATIGHPQAIGVFALPAVALEMQHRSRPEGPVKTQHAPDPNAARGALFDALAALDRIRGNGPSPGSYTIVCPRDHLHTTGRTGDGSTLLYLPTSFDGPGFIDCKHASCTTFRTARQWRRAIAALSGPSGRERC